jgi:cytochrome c-type biogenesis protein
MRRGAALLAAAVAAAGCGGEGYRPLQEGDPVPDYAAATLAGDTVSLADLRGRVVVLNVWATWCPPCIEEMPALDALQERMAAEDLSVVAVSIDARADAPAVAAFVEEHDLALTVLHDPARRVERDFRTMGVPESFLIGRDGHIARRWIGQFDPLAAETMRKVREALAVAP